jgi:hypothetical protein
MKVITIQNTTKSFVITKMLSGMERMHKNSYTFHEFFEMEFSIKLLYCRSKISKTRMAPSSVKNPHEELVL